MADQDSTAGTPGPRSTGPRLAHDLKAIREARDVTLDEVQRETRMPGDILRRFEAGELISDPHYNEVYLRNLLKSYAQALNLSPQEVSSAYEKAKAGAYAGELRRKYLEAEVEEPERAAASPPKVAEEPRPEQKPPPKSPPKSSGTAPAVAALSSPPKKKPAAEEKPPAAKPSESLPKRRVQSATAASKPIEKSWGLIIGGTVAALVVIGLILWFLFRDPGPEPEVVEAPPAADTTTAAAGAGGTTAPAVPAQEPATTAPQFQTPIQLTVTATDEPLEEFRVKVDDEARTPYWLEPGTEQTFTAQDEITLWGELGLDESGGGEYDGARLRLQGLEWTPRDGQIVRINEQTGQALLDSLSRVTNAGTTG